MHDINSQLLLLLLEAMLANVESGKKLDNGIDSGKKQKNLQEKENGIDNGNKQETRLPQGVLRRSVLPHMPRSQSCLRLTGRY